MSALDSDVQEAGRLEVQLDASQRRQQVTQERLEAIQQELENTERQLKIDERQVEADRLMLEAARARLRDQELRISMIAPATTVTVTAEATAPTEATSTIGWEDGNELLRRIFQDNGADYVTIVVTRADGEEIQVDVQRASQDAPEEVRQRPN